MDFVGLYQRATPTVVTFFFAGVAPMAEISKNGEPLAAATNAVQPIMGGPNYYSLALTGAEMDRIGSLFIRVFEAAQPDTALCLTVQDLQAILTGVFDSTGRQMLAQQGNNQQAALEAALKSAVNILTTQLNDVRRAASRDRVKR